MTFSLRPFLHISAALLCLALCALPVSPVAAKTPTVAFLSPPLERPFWIHLTQLMQSAADDLGINLVTRASHHDSESLLQDGMALLNADNQPDYLVTGFWPGATEKLMEIGERRGIKTFLINTEIDKNLGIGEPRGKYRNWIGHLYPEDVTTGYQLLDILIRQYSLHATVLKNQPINIIAVSGAPSSPASNFRLSGMKKRVATLPDARLLQATHCYWDRACALSVTADLLEKYPQTAIVWAASDLLALGAADAAKAAGKIPGKDIYIGGIDWSPSGLQGVADGTLSVTLGGHFVEGAWALVMIFDYDHGIDFKQDPGVRSETRMGAVTANNVETYLKFLANPDWKRVNFRHYSKFYNPALKHYHFDIESLFKELTGDSAGN